MDCSITLILPAYNEAARIAGTISEAVRFFQTRQSSYQIIVAADGNDGTREIAREIAANHPAISVIGENERRGKGRGIREAVGIARGRIVGFADADNKVPIEEYEKIEPLLAQGIPVVIGSRALASSRIERRQPWYRQIGSKGFGVFMHATVGLQQVHDTQCGFKFFHRSVIQELFRLQQIDGYMFDVEILAIAARLGYEIGQVPIRWRDDADSRLNLIAGNIRNVIDIFRIRRYVSRIEPRPAIERAGAAIENG
jgi:dolichyl-phosphate beta-glucosyltransferase